MFQNTGFIVFLLAYQYATGSAQLISYQQFSNAFTWLGYGAPSWQQYNSFVNSARPQGDIQDKQEAAMALTHIIHESGGLVHKREWGCEGTNGCAGRYPYQCDRPGRSYYGRGYIQLTWCYNYGPASQAIFGDDRLLDNPDLVAQVEELSWQVSFWFWKVNVHRRATSGRFGETTDAINGGYECRGNKQDVARKRFQMYKKVREAFGLDPSKAIENGCYN